MLAGGLRVGLVKAAPVPGAAGRSNSEFLDEKDDLIGTGKNPLKNKAIPNTSNMRQKDAKTDERTLNVLVRY